MSKLLFIFSLVSTPFSAKELICSTDVRVSGSIPFSISSKKRFSRRSSKRFKSLKSRSNRQKALRLK